MIIRLTNLYVQGRLEKIRNVITDSEKQQKLAFSKCNPTDVATRVVTPLFSWSLLIFGFQGLGFYFPSIVNYQSSML